MKKYKYSDLLLYEERIKRLYEECGLSYNPNNRITQYFAYLSAIEKKRLADKAVFREFIRKDRARYYYSQFYVVEICHIIDAIEQTKTNPEIIREKFDYLAQGTYLLSEETVQNAAARNASFELSLFSFFCGKQLNAVLVTPNPDIRVTTENFVYNIECKRPFSAGSVEKNMHKALKQLRKTYDERGIPTMALSLDQVVMGKDLILDARDGASALAFLDKTVTSFAKKDEPLVRKICTNEPCVVLYYLSCLAGFRTDIPMAHTMFMVGNVYNFPEEKSKLILKDLEKLYPQNED